MRLQTLSFILAPISLSASLQMQHHNGTNSSNSVAVCVGCAITCGSVFAACAFVAAIPLMIEVGDSLSSEETPLL